MENEKNLIVIAHYVNLNDINVTVSGLTDLYNNDIDDDNHNPTNKEAKGWAKEYTLFRTMARVIDQPNEPTGDSVQIIYMADYITAVGTTFMDKEPFVSDKIMYTIYQPAGQDARLYCEYGIATEAPDFDATTLDIDDGWANGNYAYEQNVRADFDNSGRWYSDNGGKGTTTRYDREAFWHHINTPKELGLEANWTADIVDGKVQYKIEGTMDGEMHHVSNVVQYTFGYTYYAVWNYLGSTENTYFVFSTVFGHVELTEDDVDTLKKEARIEGVAAVDESPELYSPSGSIFEVTGSCTPISLSGAEDPEKWLIIAWNVIETIFWIALTVVSWGGSSPALLAKLGSIGGKMAKAMKALYAISKVTKAGKVLKIGKWLKTGAIILSLSLTGITAGQISNAISNMVNSSIIYVEGSYDNIKDVSSGYLASSNGRNISWQDGKMQTNMDGYIPLPIPADLTLNSGVNLTSRAASIKSSNAYSQYEKFIVDQLLDEENEIFLMTLNYFNCSTARSSPSDINANVTVNVDDMAGSINKGDADYNVLKRLFKNLGVTAYTVPKYFKYGNELYSYTNSVMTGKVLLGNYQYTVDKLESMGIPKQAIINQGTYAYIIMDMGYNSHIVSEEDFVEQNYNVRRVIDASIECIISSNSSQAIEKVDLSNLSWEIDTNENYSGVLGFNVTFGYDGTSVPNGYYLTRGAKINTDTNKVYYTEDGNTYIAVEDGSTAPAGNYEPATAYFTLGGTKGISVKLKPSSSGPISYADLSNAGLAPTGSYYYHYFKDGDDVNAKVSATFKFGLSKYYGFSGGLSSDGNVYNYTTIGSGESLEYINITLYKFTEDAKKYNETDEIESYFEEVASYTYNDIYNACAGIKNIEILNYSLSNQQYNPVKNNFAAVRGELMSLSISPRYFTEESEGVTYVYTPVYENLDNQDCYANKYVYSQMIAGKNVKLYTRFNYNYDTNYFLTHEVVVHTEYDERGNITLQNKDSIGSLLLPTTVSGFDDRNITLSEGCRVTLAASGRCICYGYKSINDLRRQSSGSITADYSVLIK